MKVTVRKFERSASSLDCDNYLRAHGYIVEGWREGFIKLQRPRSKKVERVTRKTLLDILDELRMRDGLEPIRKRA